MTSWPGRRNGEDAVMQLRLARGRPIIEKKPDDSGQWCLVETYLTDSRPGIMGQ